ADSADQATEKAGDDAVDLVAEPRAGVADPQKAVTSSTAGARGAGRSLCERWNSRPEHQDEDGGKGHRRCQVRMPLHDGAVVVGRNDTSQACRSEVELPEVLVPARVTRSARPWATSQRAPRPASCAAPGGNSAPVSCATPLATSIDLSSREPSSCRPK